VRGIFSHKFDTEADFFGFECGEESILTIILFSRSRSFDLGISVNLCNNSTHVLSGKAVNQVTFLKEF